MLKRSRPGRINSSRRRAIIRRQKFCFWCGVQADTVDHVMPLCMGGGEQKNNVVACCARCNQRKGGSDPYIFALKLGKALYLHSDGWSLKTLKGKP